MDSNAEADKFSTTHLEEIASISSQHSPNAKTSSEMSKCTQSLLCLKSHLDKMKLEILAFLFMFSFIMTRITSSSMILNKVCLDDFKYSEDICNNLTNYTDIKTSVERVSIYYQLGYNIIQNAPAAVLSLFIGPWSDRYGRKLPLILAIIGMMLTSLGSAICAYFLDSPVEYYYIPAIFSGIFGGNITALGIFYSYISDTTTSEERTIKYAFLELSRGLALAAGTAAGGWIYQFFGYPPVFYVSMAGFGACMLWVILMLPETKGLDNDDDCGQKAKNLFSCVTFKESFDVIIKEKPRNGRLQIILLLLATFFIAISTSYGDIDFLFVHHQFNWGNAKYSTISSIYTAIGIVLLLVLFPLAKYTKMKGPTLGLIGSSSILLKLFGVGLSFYPAIYHVSNIIGALYIFASLAARSYLSKVVSKDDLGKVFQFVASGETLLPVLSTVLASLIFYATINVFPGAAYITLGIFVLLPFSVFVWLRCVPDLNYEDIDNVQDTSTTNVPL